MLKVVLVTNVPPPYRVPVFNLIAKSKEIYFSVIFCAERYPWSSWDYDAIAFEAVFLKERFYKKSGSTEEVIHNNPDIFGQLKRLNPDVVITTSFNPTALYAFCYTLVNRRKHVPFSDGTVVSEAKFSFLHRWVRSFVYRFSAVFIGASLKTKRLYESYGLSAGLLFQSHLCADNSRFMAVTAAKRFDLIFCGRFVERKNPLFAVEVAAALQNRLGRDISILFVGKGPMESEMRALVEKYRLSNYNFHGFASQQELPSLYASARVFLFPTYDDPWGVVANEACAAGLPVVTTPYAGVAGELVRDGENGYVCEPIAELWVERLVLLLEGDDLYARFSNRAREISAEYSYENAAAGIVRAALAAAVGNS
jgi:glycosyltransferase involved in cell wall biosynthesis